MRVLVKSMCILYGVRDIVVRSLRISPHFRWYLYPNHTLKQTYSDLYGCGRFVCLLFNFQNACTPEIHWSLTLSSRASTHNTHDSRTKHEWMLRNAPHFAHNHKQNNNNKNNAKGLNISDCMMYARCEPIFLSRFFPYEWFSFEVHRMSTK